MSEAFKQAVIDRAIVNWSYQKAHETDPRRALDDIITTEVRMALDPAISEAAEALLREGFEAGRFAIETREGWDFEPYPDYEDDGEMDEAFQAFLSQRQQETD